MKYCMNCGAPLREGANFCTECGTRIPKDPLPAVPAAVEEAEPVRIVPMAEPVQEPEVIAPAAEPASEEQVPAEEKKGGWLKAIIAAVLVLLLCGAGFWFFLHNRTNPLAGKWQLTSGGLLTIEIHKDGTGLVDNPGQGQELPITWKAEDGKLVFTYTAYGISETYEYKLEGDQLTIVPTDGSGDILVMKRN